MTASVSAPPRAGTLNSNGKGAGSNGALSFAAAALQPLGFTSIAGAMRDQLGLVLEDTEVAMDVLVIDRFERP